MMFNAVMQVLFTVDKWMLEPTRMTSVVYLLDGFLILLVVVCPVPIKTRFNSRLGSLLFLRLTGARKGGMGA